MSVLYTAPSSTVVQNTTTETSLLPATITLPASESVAGQSFRLTVGGIYTTTLAPPTVRIRVRLGSTVILDTAAQTPPEASSVVHYFEALCTFTYRTVGAAGTCQGSGRVLFTRGPLPADLAIFGMVNSGTTVVDTTVDEAIDLTAQWSAAAALNSITSQIAWLEMI